MITPIPYVHKSDLNQIKRCSRQLYYKRIMNLKPDFVNESSLTGSAFHKFAEEVYRHKDKWDDTRYWIEFFIKDFQDRKEKCIQDDIEISTIEDLKAEEFVEMIVEFLKQDYNKYAEPILLEAPFRFCIKRGRAKYWFEGTIDQLLKISVKYLNGMGSQAELHDKDYVYIHRDIKTGSRKQLTEIGLTTDDNINVYSYALAYGLFNLSGIDNGPYNKSIHHIPFAHALYYVRDHLKYKRNTEKNKVGDYKGQGMYFVKKPLEDLNTRMEDELINLWKKVNYGPYTCDGSVHNLCDRYCAYRRICLYDWKNP